MKTSFQEMKIDAAPIPSPIRVEEAYDGSSLLFRLLRIHGWGPLLNLGYFDLLSLGHACSFPQGQRRLVRKSVNLLNLRPGEAVLDVACGRGWSTHHIACTHPVRQAIGLDLLPLHVQISRGLYGSTPRLEYQEGDATRMPFSDGYFDALSCIEAAFHFDRPRFLSETFRVLKPGGRAVIVDFMWNERPDEQTLHHPDVDTVRSVWQWNDFDSVAEYHSNVTNAGLVLRDVKDWTFYVTVAFYHLCRLLTILGGSTLGRQWLCLTRPELRNLTSVEWAQLGQIVQAHEYIKRRTCYKALVLEKPR